MKTIKKKKKSISCLIYDIANSQGTQKLSRSGNQCIRIRISSQDNEVYQNPVYEKIVIVILLTMLNDHRDTIVFRVFGYILFIPYLITLYLFIICVCFKIIYPNMTGILKISEIIFLRYKCRRLLCIVMDLQKINNLR